MMLLPRDLTGLSGVLGAVWLFASVVSFANAAKVSNNKILKNTYKIIYQKN